MADRKILANEFRKYKKEAQFLFELLDGNDLLPLIKTQISMHCGSKTRLDKVRWLFNTDYSAI